jgi:hypothetical protein
MASIPHWHREIVNIVCMFENEQLTSFMDLQVHILIHLPNEVELAGVLSCHWIFFLEMYIKKLKGFVWQREKLEGFIAKGDIVYESFYYVSEYIKKIDDTLGEVVWDDQWDENKREGELLQTNGKGSLIKSKSLIFFQICTEKLFTLKLILYIWSHTIHFEFLYTLASLEIDSINKFVLYNVESTQPRVTRIEYEEKRRKWDSEKKVFKWLNGRIISHPNHLK